VENSRNSAIENDLLYIFHIDIDNIEKLKQLVKYLCLSKPYELNISNLSKRIGISRDTLYKYIHYLTLADVLNRIDVLNKKDTSFLKPSKLYLQNPNLYYTFCLNNEIGTIREIFFINQLEVNHQVNYSKIGDFLVNEKYIFEIGGKNKNKYQIKDIANSYLAIDDIEIGFQNKIPLYLFGFLF
jgi:predicted AAA+ superfamily ATPase